MADYASKRDWWIVALLWLCLGFMIIGFGAAFTEPVATWMRWLTAVFFGVFGVLTVWLLVLPYRTVYILEPETLTIRVGPFRHVIAISEIVEVVPTRNPLSAPAWSLDRVRIGLSSSGFGALISPERQTRFFDELESLAPQLERVGNRLVLRQDHE